MKVDKETSVPINLKSMMELEQWVKKNKRLPNKKGVGKEKKLYNAYHNIKCKYIKPYLTMPEEGKKIRKQAPYIEKIVAIHRRIENEVRVYKYLPQARQLKKWYDKKGKLPPYNAKSEEEKRMYNMYENLRVSVLDPYSNLSESQKKEYLAKYPGMKEVIDILDEISTRTYLRNTRSLEQFYNKHGRMPSSNPISLEHRRVSQTEYAIRQDILKPYFAMTEEQRKAYDKTHPSMDEVLRVFKKIQTPDYPRIIAEAMSWCNEHGRYPGKDSEDEKWHRDSIYIINRRLVKPYLNLSDEEKEEYERKNPKYVQVIQATLGIFAVYGNKEQRRLANLVRQDKEKRIKLKEARELESTYEKQLEGQQIGPGKEG